MPNFVVQPNDLKLNADPSFKISEQALTLMSEKNILLNIHFCDHDKDSMKPPLVLIHGDALASEIVFKEQIAYFSSHYRVISFDFLGRGESTKIESIPNLSAKEQDILFKNFYNLHAMVAQAMQFLNFCHINKAHFIGCTLGDAITSGIAADSPRLINSITNVASRPIVSSTALSSECQEYIVKFFMPEWLKSPAPICINGTGQENTKQAIIRTKNKEEYFKLVDVFLKSFSPQMASVLSPERLFSKPKAVEKVEAPGAVLQYRSKL